MKTKQHGNAIDIEFDNPKESIDVLEAFGFKNIPEAMRRRAAEQSNGKDHKECGENLAA